MAEPITPALTIIGFDGGVGLGREFILFRPMLMRAEGDEKLQAPWHAISRTGARALIDYLHEELARLESLPEEGGRAQ